MDALTFLQGVAGAARAAGQQPLMRLATVDPVYDSSTFPGTLPKVTFDGETTLSGKSYAVMSGYLPTAGDRVVLLPVGTNYLIIGALDSDASAQFGGTLAVLGDLFAVNDLYVFGNLSVDGVGQRLFARKTGDTTIISDDSFNADPHLSVNVAANAVYEMRSTLIFSSATDADLSYYWSAPADSTFDWASRGPANDIASYQGGIILEGRVLSDYSLVGGNGVGNRMTIKPSGLLVTGGSAGAFTLNWCQGASKATNTVMYSGSYLVLDRVA